MFTGIVQEKGKVVSAQAGKLTVSAGSALSGMQPGGSIAVNGVCLTATGFGSNTFSVDIMPETLRRTNLGLLKAGSSVNLERPMTLGGELGGHLVQGHVDGTGKLTSIKLEGEARLVRFQASPEVMRYVVVKGFIAVDGASLTVVDRDDSSFSVSLVGFTLKNTTLGEKKTGDTVNLEADIIAKYVEQFTSRRPGVTAELLKEHGFLS
ncbi:MAG: riboflavin synthase [Dehalococcoidales bacterium]|nr:riboflavin synthase [Dehalococcoidales bacterium]